MVFKGCADSSELDEPMGCQTSVILFVNQILKTFEWTEKYQKIRFQFHMLNNVEIIILTDTQPYNTNTNRYKIITENKEI